MGLRCRIKSNLEGFKRLIEETSGNACGREAAAAAKDAMDVYMRKDTMHLANTVIVEPWLVRYCATYSIYVWDSPPEIVSPRNSAARANPDQQPKVAELTAEAISLYLKKAIK